MYLPPYLLYKERNVKLIYIYKQEKYFIKLVIKSKTNIINSMLQF